MLGFRAHAAGRRSMANLDGRELWPRHGRTLIRRPLRREPMGHKRACAGRRCIARSAAASSKVRRPRLSDSGGSSPLPICSQIRRLRTLRGRVANNSFASRCRSAAWKFSGTATATLKFSVRRGAGFKTDRPDRLANWNATGHGRFRHALGTRQRRRGSQLSALKFRPVAGERRRFSSAIVRRVAARHQRGAAAAVPARPGSGWWARLARAGARPCATGAASPVTCIRPDQYATSTRPAACGVRWRGASERSA
jgi:hypothetical protein